jgi:divalent metal cation (Fe/Co/Zn/Cd) transporter
MVGENIPRKMRNDIRAIIKKQSVIRHINNIRSMYIGNNNFILMISVDVEDSCRGSTIERMTEQIKTDITHNYSNAKYIYIDVKDSEG